MGVINTKEVVGIFNPPKPNLKVFNIGNVEVSNIKIRGTINDANDKQPILTINGKQVEYNKYGEFEYEVQLKEGENEFTVIATNNFGMETIEKVVGVYNLRTTKPTYSYFESRNH